MPDQQHPQYKIDRALLTDIIKDGTPSDLHLVEIARLRVRYAGFPGARDIQADLDKILNSWKLTEATLFEQTRQLHQQENVYKQSFSKRDDWA